MFGSKWSLIALRWRVDRKSTRLNSSHSQISYAVFCLKKKKNTSITTARFMPPSSHDHSRNLPTTIAPQRPLRESYHTRISHLHYWNSYSLDPHPLCC